MKHKENKNSDSIRKSSVADNSSCSTHTDSMIISEALGNIDVRYIQEAEQFTPSFSGKKASAGRSVSADLLAATHKKAAFRRHHPGASHPFLRAAAAAALALCLFIAGISILSPSGKMTVTAHAQGTGEEITAAGTVISTGIINDDGSMTGKPLFFYLSGENIAKVRFSCKNRQLYFMDWTEKRDEFGLAQNFTVEYGADKDEYYYLTIDWVPDAIVKELKTGCPISGLPEEMRNDLIVMEITFADGSTDTKAIFISLLDNGTFFASFDDYKISSADLFVQREDSKPIPREILYSQGGRPTQNEEYPIGDAPAIEDEYQEADPDMPETTVPENTAMSGAQTARAEEAARNYYAGTVFEVISIEAKALSEKEIVFSVRVSRGGIVQEPDRTITLQLQDDIWQVTNEGY